ncbi:MAG: efflux RND transporter permease subunit, partial [Planctomycetota bacterium]
MNLSGLAMKYRPVVLTFVGLITVWGTFTFLTMPRREDPQFTIRTCVVMTTWPGAPTIKVEELITDKLEETLSTIEEVDYLNSETINGQSTIFVNLDDNVPVDAIQNVWDKVRAKVEQVPMPASNVRTSVNDEFGDSTILLLGIYQNPMQNENGPESSDRWNDPSSIDPDHRYSPRQLEIYTDQVRDAIRLLPGVGKVEKYGVQDEAVYIETDLGTWSQVDLTIDSLRQLVESRNIVSPGGIIDTRNGRFNVKPGGEFDAVDEINSLVIGAVKSGKSANQVSLQNIGLTVKRDYADPAQAICRFTDETGTYPAVMLGVTMKSGANIIDICNSAMDRVNRLVNVEQALPRDLTVKPVSNLSDNVSAKIDDVVGNVLSAIVIVVIVVYLFVGLRTSLVMAANIPFVVLSAIAIIRVFGVELEQISLASIIIALGLLVDNAVQVCDQTRTNLLEGMTPREAAVNGARTLMFPMFSGTLTTVAAFLPMMFVLTGGGGEYVYSLPVTLSATLLISWLFAMSICVILAAAFIRAPKHPDRPAAPLPRLSQFLESLPSRLRKKDGKTDTPDQEETSSPATSSRHDNVFLRLYGLSAHVALKFKWVT